MTYPVAVDLVALHAVALTDLAAAFPPPSGGNPGWTIGWYVRVTGKMPVPSISLELDDFDSPDGGDVGNGQWSANVRFRAYVMTDYQDPQYRIKCRLYAAQLAHFLMSHQWTGVVGAEPVRVLGAFTDRFEPIAGAGQYDCMRVEFEQCMRLGVHSLPAETIPTQVWLGFAPYIGAANIKDYKLIAYTGPTVAEMTIAGEILAGGTQGIDVATTV